MILELMLATLIETFVFSATTKDIEWAMGGLQSPVLKGSNDITPQMWLNVSLVQKWRVGCTVDKRLPWLIPVRLPYFSFLRYWKIIITAQTSSCTISYQWQFVSKILKLSSPFSHNMTVNLQAVTRICSDPCQFRPPEVYEKGHDLAIPVSLLPIRFVFRRLGGPIVRHSPNNDDVRPPS